MPGYLDAAVAAVPTVARVDFDVDSSQRDRVRDGLTMTRAQLTLAAEAVAAELPGDMAVVARDGAAWALEEVFIPARTAPRPPAFGTAPGTIRQYTAEEWVNTQTGRALVSWLVRRWRRRVG